MCAGPGGVEHARGPPAIRASRNSSNRHRPIGHDCAPAACASPRSSDGTSSRIADRQLGSKKTSGRPCAAGEYRATPIVVFAGRTRSPAGLFRAELSFPAVAEDVPSLLRGEAQGRARVVAARAVLFEEFVEAECQAGRARLQLSKGPSQVLLHGHCHQKSMGRVAAATALLSRIPGAKVVNLDTGCCGMAGSFGYTRDHYEVSRAIG